MNWGISILVGLITAACCGAAAVWLAALCADWYRISNFEGAAGYWIVAMGLLGILFGVAVGIVTSRVLASGAAPGFLKTQGLALAVGLGVLAVAGVVARIGGDVAPTVGGEELSLLVEFRCPKGAQPKYKSEVDGNACTLTSLGNGNKRRNPLYGTVRWREAKEVDGQWTVPCEVFLHSQRELLVGLTINPAYSIEIALPQPAFWSRKQMEWGQWRSDRILREVGKPQPEFTYRFRVRPYRDWKQEEQAREAVAAQERDRRFAMLRPESPLVDWIRYAEGDGERGQRAREVVRKRVAEVPELLRSRDSEVLRLLAVAMGNIIELPAAAEDALRRSGLVIAERVRDFAGSAEDDAAREMAAQIRGAFYWWHISISRVAGHSPVNFRNELLAIRKESAKRREDSDWKPLVDATNQALEEMDAQGN